METIDLECSFDDDEDDIYLNSVAKLNALKRQTASKPSKKNEEPPKEGETIIVGVPEEIVAKPRRSRRTKWTRFTHPKKQSNKKATVQNDSDLEIVSVEENANCPNTVMDDITVVNNLESSEDESYDITIKILWRSKDMHRLNIHQNETFRKVFEYFANLEKVSMDEILITKTDKTITKNDTPTSINWSVIDILEGGIVNKDSAVCKMNSKEKDDDACTIKVQTTSKKSIIASVRQDENFKALLTKCAEELDVEESKIKLYFDGELVAVTDTPNALEIEDEACFDLRQSS